jgi:glucose/arabinose dehydrogenase
MQYYRLRIVAMVLAASACTADDPEPSFPGPDRLKPLVAGLRNPDSVCVGTGGLIYVTEMGEIGKDGDGRVLVIKEGKALPFATGLDDPRGIVAWEDSYYVADRTRVVKVDDRGKATPFATADMFPAAPHLLDDIALEPAQGILYVSDAGDRKGKEGAVYRIELKTRKISLVADASRSPDFKSPNGLVMDGAWDLLMLDSMGDSLLRIRLADHSVQKVADGFLGGDGLDWDRHGRLLITSSRAGQVWGIPRPGAKPILMKEGFVQPANLCLDAGGGSVLVPDTRAGTLTSIPIAIPGWEVDDSPLPIGTEIAFPNLQWTGWSAESENGLVTQFKPTLLTHAGDGSHRLFVATQEGVVHAFPNDDRATQSSIFLDISSRVRYTEKENEEGLIGLAFHPQFKTNGEFFVSYTDTHTNPPINVVSRFRLSPSDPGRGDPDSEEVLLRFSKRYWNPGLIAFGPDGFLYVAHGDDEATSDPRGHAQDLNNLLGKVLRIDVDRREKGKFYAIPPDNPFIGTENAAPEIWAYGLRNLWKMAFDPVSGQLWAGDVGEDLYEEINIIKAGGNYGWNIRESLHPFGPQGVAARKDLIDPVWEYHHDIGKSITGGFVYRGRKIPELAGAYLYADYVKAGIWALTYDAAKGRVVANREIESPGLPIVSFGEDEDGEAYFTIFTTDGHGIYRFVRKQHAGPAASIR